MRQTRSIPLPGEVFWSSSRPPYVAPFCKLLMVTSGAPYFKLECELRPSHASSAKRGRHLSSARWLQLGFALVSARMRLNNNPNRHVLMFVRVLGSAAGGGLPQWNCNCLNCAIARHRMSGVKPRTQTSVAVSADGQKWTLLNASPDVREQIAATPPLQPRSGDVLRVTPIASIVLTSADVDQVAGLLSLREGQPFGIYSTARVLAALASNPIFDVLDPA